MKRLSALCDTHSFTIMPLDEPVQYLTQVPAVLNYTPPAVSNFHSHPMIFNQIPVRVYVRRYIHAYDTYLKQLQNHATIFNVVLHGHGR